MRILFSTPSAPHYMAPPVLSDEQVNCGPFFPDCEIDGRVISLSTPCGEYDLSQVASRLPADQQPDVVVCVVDSSWFNVPRNFSAFRGPKIALIADTHHMTQPVLGMISYLSSQKFDRHIFLYTRHHIDLFRAAGIKNLFWLPGLTFPHGDAIAVSARKQDRVAQIAHIGQSSTLYRRRLALAGALARAGLPLVFREGTQREALDFYGSSLIGFNATANGDFNLRAYEITAAGSLLLMDRLSPESGLSTLWKDGREFVEYQDANDLVERARHYLDRPDEARRIGEAGASWFDRHLNALRRRELFTRIVSDGKEEPMFALPAPPRFAVSPFGGQAARYVAALAVYEHIQKSHSVAEVVRVRVDETVPADLTRLCSTLPRVVVKKQFGSDEQPDYLVISAARALALTTLDVPRVWCWDATAEQTPRLTAQFGAAGLVALRDGVAFFGLAAADSEPSVDALATEARVRLQNCDAAGALELARRALEQNPHSVEAYLVIAEIALESGKAELFGKMVGQLRGLAPKDPRVPLLELSARSGVGRQRLVDRLLATAMRHISTEALPAAKAAAARATKIDPNFAAAWHWLGRVSFRLAQSVVGPARQQEQTLALDGLRRAVELAPHRADFCFELGLALRQAGLLLEAVAAFERAVAADSLETKHWIFFAEALIKNRERERAVAILEQALAQMPSNQSILRCLDEARRSSDQPDNPPVHRSAPEECEMLPPALAPILAILNNKGVHAHERSVRLAAAFAATARQATKGLRLPIRRALMAYQAWFGLDAPKLVAECLERGQLLVLLNEDVVPSRGDDFEIRRENFRMLEHRGINLWRVCRYRSALLSRKMIDQVDPDVAGDQAVLRDLYGVAAALVDRALDYFECYRPETIVFAQGHDLVSAVLRQMAILRGLRVISLENIFRKDRLLWEDVSGISVNQNLSRNYYWRHRDFVSDETARESVAAYLEQVKAAKSGEHASPVTPLPEGPSSKLPTITYLAQVGTDSSVLFGLRGFESQVEVIVALASYVASRRMRLLVKLHPKENPAFKDEMVTVRGLTAQGLAAHPRFSTLQAELGTRLVLDDTNRFDTYDLIRRAQVCVTINSQAGLEAAIHGREVVLCGDAFYGTLGFTHEATDARSLEFVLDRILNDGLRLNHGPAVRGFFHIFTELYCLPKTERSLLALLDGRPHSKIPGDIEGRFDPPRESAANSMVVIAANKVDPSVLVTTRRLDLIVKYQFFRALLCDQHARESEALYRKHIYERTRGVEPVDHTTGSASGKASIDDYVRSCQSLLVSMRQKGFDDAYAIPVSTDGGIGNGAHRIACALALGLKVSVQPCSLAGPEWGADWFRQKEFGETEMARLLHGWCEVHGERSALFILWAPIEGHWEEAEQEIARNLEIVGRRDFDFSAEPAAFRSVVYDVYSHGETSALLEHIDRKVADLGCAPPKMRVVLAFNRSPGERTGDLATRTKRNLRARFSEWAPEDKFVTCHASDSPAELAYLANVLLDSNNTQWFRWRSSSEPRKELLSWISHYKQELKKLGIPLSDCCVVGSSSLEVFGLRNSTDLDFTLTSKWRHRHFNAGITHVTHLIDVVTEGYHRTRPPAESYTDDRLIGDSRHHFWFRGVKFAAPGIIRDRKDFSRRPKDVVDVTLLDEFLASVRGGYATVA